MSTAAPSGPHADHRHPDPEPPVRAPRSPAQSPPVPVTTGLGSVALALAVVGAAWLVADLTSPVFGAATGALLVLGAAAVRALRRAARTADRIFAEELPPAGPVRATGVPVPREPEDDRRAPGARRTGPPSRRRAARDRRSRRTADRNGR
ncbi:MULTISPECIES: hypothetical protein [Actinosynnema]|uniref:hypothetical protein n=1 Tax=Actinosynnema TaxID=40566 RepID=UPI0020A4326D|nr:hypothetical protein [Actinosynnema pretiosum]MCP2096988.1 hypothetical protein [Actinosynnema pretiosum]